MATTPTGSFSTSELASSTEGMTRPRSWRPRLGVVAEGVGRPADLVGVLDQRLAALRGHQPAELVGVGAQPGSDPVEQLAALAGRGPPPAGQPPPGRLHGRVDLVGRGRQHLGQRLLGGRVGDHLDRAPAGRLAPTHMPVLIQTR